MFSHRIFHDKKSNVMNRLSLYLFIALLIQNVPIFAEPTVAEPEARSIWVPPGKLISVGAHRLHIFCMGDANDKPTVIIDSGLGGFSLEWREIQTELSDRFQICTYDRAGYGWSDPGPFPRTTKTIITELRILLKRSKIQPPYLLLGHSFGGYNMMYFSKVFPKEVAGLVLIDSSHPQQADWFPAVYPDLPEGRRRTRFVSTAKLPNNYPYDHRELAYHLMSAKKARNALRYESMNFEISGNQVGRLGELPKLPLVVLTRGERAWPKTERGNKLETVWTRLQNELARLSKGSTHVIADLSGHYIHLDQPVLIKEAILEIVKKNDCKNIYAEVKQEVVETKVGEC